VTVERRPVRRSRGLALVAASVAVLTSILTVPGLGLGAAGFLGVLAGTLRPSRGLLDGGVAALGAGVLLSAATTPLAGLSLAGAVAAVLAWDLGEHAIGLGEQLGHEAPTRRGELAHAAASTGVGLAAAVVGYVVYRVAWGGQPLAALLLLLFAALFLMLSVRE